MGFFRLFAKPDPVRENARRFAKLLVNYKRKYPDRPLRDAIKPAAPMLRRLLPENSSQYPVFEMIISDEYQVNNVREMCCALVAILTDTPVDASERYGNIVRTVEAELQSLGYQDPS